MRKRSGALLVGMVVVGACSSQLPAVEADSGTGSGDDAGADAPAGNVTELAYVANYLSGISGFAIRPTGELVALAGAPFDRDRRFYGVAIHPSRPILYAAEYTGHALDAYRIQPDGTLLPLGDPVALAHPAVSIAVDPLGRFVYASDFDDVGFTDHALQTFAIDAGGALAPVSSLPRTNEVNVIAPDPSGQVVYTTDGDLGVRAFSVAPDGTLAELATSPFAATTVRGGWLAFHPTEHILYTARQALEGFRIDAAPTAVPGSPFAGGADADPGAIALAVDRRGRFLCVVSTSAGTLTVYAIRGDGSVAVPGTSYDAGSSAYSVAIDPDGQFVYVPTDFGDIAAFSVDPTSFALTPLPRAPGSVGLQPEMVIFRPAS